MADKPEVKDCPPYLDYPKPCMPTMSAVTRLQLIDEIISNCYESINFNEQTYLAGIIDAVYSVMHFREDDHDRQKAP